MVSGSLSGFPAFAILSRLNTNLKLHFILKINKLKSIIKNNIKIRILDRNKYVVASFPLKIRDDW